MNLDSLIIAGVAALGPTIAAMAAWRQAKGTRAEVATNHGKRAGEYIEMMGALSADVQIVKIESRLATARLAKKLEKLHIEHGEILAGLHERVDRIEGHVDPQSGLGGGRIAQ